MCGRVERMEDKSESIDAELKREVRDKQIQERVFYAVSSVLFEVKSPGRWTISSKKLKQCHISGGCLEEPKD